MAGEGPESKKQKTIQSCFTKATTAPSTTAPSATIKDVVVAKQAKPALTASKIAKDAQEMAAIVEPGMVLGVECASEQEPYIVLKATSKVYSWSGEDEYTWMGWMRAGDRVVDTIKFEKYGSSDCFWSLSEKRFPIFEEDLRSIIKGHKAVEVRQSSRSQPGPAIERIEMERAEVDNLEERVLMNLNSKHKARDRPKV